VKHFISQFTQTSIAKQQQKTAAKQLQDHTKHVFQFSISLELFIIIESRNAVTTLSLFLRTSGTSYVLNGS